MNKKRLNKKDCLALLAVSVFVFSFLGMIILNSPNKEKETKDDGIKIASLRKMAVAGKFYPENAQELDSQLENFLALAKKVEVGEKLRILIVPHAGTVYSGQVAAEGFRQIDPNQYDRFIILGVSHENAINHAAVLTQGLWETPLGSVNIDEETASRIVNNTTIRSDTNPHTKEHSIELISIFLKKLKEDVSIVPILLGKVDDALLNTLTYKLVNLMDDRTLLIISTDLSHYPNYDDATKADNNIVEAVLTGNLSELEKAEEENRSANYKNFGTSACGFQPMRVAMKINEVLEMDKIIKFSQANSGDISGDRSRVVGYTSIGFFSKDIKTSKLDETAKKEALTLARDTLNNLFSKSKIETKVSSSDLERPMGAFTTITVDGSLRGCIGLFEPEQSLENVIEYTTTSAALNDPRFSPIKAEELEKVNIELSVMTPLTKIYDWNDFEIGKHGVKLVANSKSGTLLPQVATDNNWGKKEFLENICSQKMNLDKECYKNEDTKIYIFETQIFSESDYSN